MDVGLKRQGKEALGIFVDGLELRLAHLSLKGKKIIIEDLEKAALSRKLDEHVAHRAGFGEEQELFSASEEGGDESVLLAEKTDSNAEVLRDLLSNYPLKKSQIAYSIAEPSVYYHTLEGNPGKNGQLKKKALEELKAIRTGAPDPGEVELIPSSEKGTLCVVREEGLHLINLLEEIKPFVGNRLPRIPFIDTVEVALMNLARLSHDLVGDEITVVIYVGVEFSRIIFMRGKEHLHFAPLITEGADSPNLDNRLYSRILLEQDNLDTPQIHRILMAGSAHKIGLKKFLEARIPSVRVEYLNFESLRKGNPRAQTGEVCSEYAIPIVTAWRVLDQKNKKFSPVNLLPASLIERQKFFKLKWHGCAIMVLLFFATLFFTWNYLKGEIEVNQRSSILKEKEQRLADNRALKASIEALQNRLARGKNVIAVYDSLVPGSDLWTRILTKSTKRIADLNSLWLTSITSTSDGGMEITGVSLLRGRIPKFASLFGGAMLKRVTEKQIRDRRVYEFQLYVPDIASR